MKQVFWMFLSVTACRNWWRCNHWHRCTEEQCSEARDQTHLQISPRKGKRSLVQEIKKNNLRTYIEIWFFSLQFLLQQPLVMSNSTLSCFLLWVYNNSECFICSQDLMKDLKSELSKNLERLIIGLMLTPAEFDAKMMRKAIEVK